MEVRAVALSGKCEVRNDGGAWLSCDIEGNPSFVDADIVTFYPSVASVMGRVVPQIVSLGESQHVAGQPFRTGRIGSPCRASLWIHNSNGGVTRIEAGYLIGHLHIERSAAVEQKADVQTQIKRKAS